MVHLIHDTNTQTGWESIEHNVALQLFTFIKTSASVAGPSSDGIRLAAALPGHEVASAITVSIAGAGGRALKAAFTSYNQREAMSNENTQWLCGSSPTPAATMLHLGSAPRQEPKA